MAAAKDAVQAGPHPLELIAAAEPGAAAEPPAVRSRTASVSSFLLAATGLHQPREWRHSRFRSAASAVVSTVRLRRLAALKSRPGRTPEETGRETPDADALQAQAAVASRLSRCHLEQPTLITKVLTAIDPTFLDKSPGAVNQLTGRGATFVTLCSTVTFHFLRLLLRDVLFDKVATASAPNVQTVLLKRRLVEIYLLSTLHSIGCAAFSLGKILRGRWDCPQGSETMLCFSLGYTSYSLLTLRRQLLSDPLFTINEVANFVKMTSCLKSQGVTWIVPLLMSSEIPMACLNLLRMMAEVGVSRSTFAWRFMLGAWTTSFTAIKGVILPAAIVQLIIRRAKDYPELHQPNFLPGKVALIVRILLNFTWLGAVAKHWQESPVDGGSSALPSLGELTSSWALAWKAFRTGLNPISAAYFLVIQSFYFIAPAALPALLAGLRRPKYRWGAGSALALLGMLTFWPIDFETPYWRRPPKSKDIDLLGRMVRKYFSFRSVWEEPLQKDRRYLICTLPHGVMPFSNNCLQSELLEKGFVPQFAAASVILRIPLLRQLVRFGGGLPATTKYIKKALSWPFPNNVTFLVPGGIAEIFLMRDDIEQVFVKHRKGFVKLALQAGTDLVPVYGLGHTHLFKVLDKSSALGSFLMTLSRRLKVSLPLAAGRFGMPLVPYKKQVIALVGRPIRIDAPVPNPTPEQIDEVHGQFVAELKRIFDKHKHLIPSYADKRLYFEDEEVPPRPKRQKNPGTVDTLFPSTLTLPSKL